MTILEAFNGTVDHYTRKLPAWAHALLLFWLLFATLVYFGLIELPEIGWWRVIVMAPIALLLMAVLLQIIAFFVGWISAPARWLLNKWRAAK